MVKVLNPEQEKQVDRFIMTNAITSGLLGLSVGVVGVGVLNRVWPFFKRLPTGIKFSMVGTSTIALLTIRTESQSLLHERFTYGYDPDTGVKPELSSLSAPGGIADRAVSYFLENKYKVLGVAWALAASGSVYKLYLNKNISWTQRIVQARMYAQALTVVGLLGLAFVSTAVGDKSNDKRKVVYSSEY
ncbi:hypothetical protein BB561_003116 [Smittium simulii]|uniref:HIG1 domain-containing protein n=1 Tax=Smittium simulii TaxID=133385 RepID=A0A2T9YMU5_9FUNG|nr:hypothetical protein BB561_003116 [Smittium simulii]